MQKSNKSGEHWSGHNLKRLPADISKSRSKEKDISGNGYRLK
jgi:hypothetical protein